MVPINFIMPGEEVSHSPEPANDECADDLPMISARQLTVALLVPCFKLAVMRVLWNKTCREAGARSEVRMVLSVHTTACAPFVYALACA